MSPKQKSTHLFLILLLIPSITATQSCISLLQEQAEKDLSTVPIQHLKQLFPHSPSLATAEAALKKAATRCKPSQSVHITLPRHTDATLHNPSIPSTLYVCITPSCRLLHTPPVYSLSLPGFQGAPAQFLAIDVYPTVPVNVFIRLLCDGEPLDQTLLGVTSVRKLRDVAGRALLVGRVGE